MRVDHVRWCQPKGKERVTCDPPRYETTEYIGRHMVAYSNPNLTVCRHPTSIKYIGRSMTIEIAVGSRWL
jgi:hypothetical protein